MASQKGCGHFQKICEAVSFAHAHNVLHRDLKPQNIMVGTFGEVLVMDWGLARVLSGEAPVNMNAEKQTAGFQPKAKPDRKQRRSRYRAWRGPGHSRLYGARAGPRRPAAIGLRTDVYALGAVLDFLLRSGGHRPKALAAISRKATAEDMSCATARWKTCGTTFHIILTACLSAPIPKELSRGRGDGQVRNRAWILLILAYLVMRAVFILWRAR